MTEPLFNSADSALKFAFNFSGQHYAKTMLIPIASNGICLGGLDGAAQAGIILAEVKKLGKITEALLTARYAPAWLPCDCGHSCCSGKVKNRKWVDAIPYIVLEMSRHCFKGKERHTTLILVQAYYVYLQTQRKIHQKEKEPKYDYTALADIAGVHPTTVKRNMLEITRFLRGTRRKQGMDAVAYMRAEEALIEKGIVGEMI
ncbi:MAG: hypothetical protein NC548_55665 [Lachnospiraceae bacterium]|nr:hypothetical protein [Lachnospiraceae bacterium]